MDYVQLKPMCRTAQREMGGRRFCAFWRTAASVWLNACFGASAGPASPAVSIFSPANGRGFVHQDTKQKAREELGAQVHSRTVPRWVSGVGARAGLCAQRSPWVDSPADQPFGQADMGVSINGRSQISVWFLFKPHPKRGSPACVTGCGTCSISTSRGALGLRSPAHFSGALF